MSRRRYYAPQYRDIRPDRDTLYLIAGEEYRQRRSERASVWYSVLTVGALAIAAIVGMEWHSSAADRALERLVHDEQFEGATEPELRPAY
jgi:hypothetical protein